MTSVKKTSYSFQERFRIVEDFKQSGLTVAHIARKYAVPHTTLHRWVTCETELAEKVALAPNRMRNRAAKFPQLESKLHDWYVEGGGGKKTGQEICARACEIATELGVLEFTPNNGWLRRFKQRHGISLAGHLRRRTDADNCGDKSLQVNEVL